MGLETSSVVSAGEAFGGEAFGDALVRRPLCPAT